MDEFLRSVGVDPSTAIHQEGLLNYAGPVCPGDGWTCTTETTRPIVQTAQAGGTNIFECGLDEGDCVTVQRGAEPEVNAVTLFTGTASAGPGPITNMAKCNAADNPPNQPVQNCTISQTNESGKNSASVNMIVNQNDTGEAVDQDASQTASVIQENGSGPNLANISQVIRQKAESNSASVTQSQDAFQSVILQQTSGTGDNSAQLVQSELQDAKAKGETTTQTQNTDPGLDVVSDVNQTSTTGKNALLLMQSTDQVQDVQASGNASQTQGAGDGGQKAEIHQESSGVSTYDADQDELQTQTGTAGALVQTQIGPIDCCLIFSQLGNPSNECTVDQNSVLSSGDGADQTTTAITSFRTDGNCTATIHLETNDGEFNDSASGQFFFQVSNCTNDECSGGLEEGEQFEASGATAAGTGLRNRDSGTISIAGIPESATVTKAVLVWGILYAGATPPSTITFDGVPINATQGQVSGPLCWGDTNTIGYSADVTPLVTGNGDYVVSDPPRGTTREDADPSGDLPFTDGATLVVIYSGGGANDQVLTDFSYDTNTDADADITRNFNGINSVGGFASLILAGPDGQDNAGETFQFTGNGSFTLENTWDGSDPQHGPSFPIGNLWDTDSYDVSSVLPAGQSTFEFDYVGGNDCIGVGAAVLSVSQNSGPVVD